MMGGYLVCDGVLGELVRGKRRVLQRIRGALPASNSTPKTTAGARCTPRAGAHRAALAGLAGQADVWTLTDWRWDGVQGYGEDQEFFAREQVRALIG